MNDPGFRRVAIVGFGFIGASIAKAAVRRWPALTIAPIDAGESLAKAAGADLVVLAAPVLASIARLAELPDPPAVCVTEVPLLYEVGGEERFDAVVVVTASPEVRISRQIGPMQDREQRLISDEDKVARADFAYVNDGSLEDLDAFVADVVGRLTSEAR